MNKPKVLICFQKPTGCTLIRQQIPLSALATFDLIDLSKVERSDSQMKHYEEIEKSDIIIFGREISAQGFELLKFAKSLGKKIIYDTDDNLLQVPSWSPAAYIYRDPNVQKAIITFLENSDLIGVTNETLREFYSSYNHNIIVLPNFTLPVFFNNTMPKNSPIRRIIWAGSQTHRNDLREVESALIDIANENSNVEITFCGYTLDSISKVPKFNFVPFKDPISYFTFLSNVNADIGLAPLTSDYFNKCKSNIKLIEYGFSNIVPLATDIYEYHNYLDKFPELQVDNTYKDWVRHLRKFIRMSDDELMEWRKKINKHTQTYNDLERNLMLWYSTFCKLLNRPVEKFTPDYFVLTDEKKSRFDKFLHYTYDDVFSNIINKTKPVSDISHNPEVTVVPDDKKRPAGITIILEVDPKNIEKVIGSFQNQTDDRYQILLLNITNDVIWEAPGYILDNPKITLVNTSKHYDFQMIKDNAKYDFLVFLGREYLINPTFVSGYNSIIMDRDKTVPLMVLGARTIGGPSKEDVNKFIPNFENRSLFSIRNGGLSKSIFEECEGFNPLFLNDRTDFLETYLEDYELAMRTLPKQDIVILLNKESIAERIYGDSFESGDWRFLSKARHKEHRDLLRRNATLLLNFIKQMKFSSQYYDIVYGYLLYWEDQYRKYTKK